MQPDEFPSVDPTAGLTQPNARPFIPTTQVRAGSLQELVYKQGQAGVTKASVTVTFNNQDKKASPVGYEHADRIAVTRQVGTLASRCGSAWLY